MKHHKLQRALLGLTLAAASALAQAGVLGFDQRADFNAAGHIAVNSNFDDFGRGYHFPGSDFSRGDVTYVSDENLVVGAGTAMSVGKLRPVMSNEYWSPLVAQVNEAPRYSMLGFDAAVTAGPVDITIDTNQGSYAYHGVSLPNGSAGFGFKGFVATGVGEYFTGFRIDSQGSGYLAGVTDVALGQVSAVPEPGSAAMLLAGLGMLGWLRRHKGGSDPRV
ncbi:PEP-CTERM sorting domain-containing protein [Rugamonas sp. DEMB1]|uniref:PEP-CTERM sorting domain-containing protein n=1 Tax=Rugamonas sp. DEMB1 TaxID=3039386 RepID=UPI00244CFA33|nr:PEP-CTERM sorting domain-containing protein [Rugamonas sp. DEMB1]WGG53271.1 PEP-CTERM sorting domain-containing protein [Rugamonas sp. DEMB1]